MDILAEKNYIEFSGVAAEQTVRSWRDTADTKTFIPCLSSELMKTAID